MGSNVGLVTRKPVSEITLTCAHVLLFRISPPNVDDEIYCPRCVDMRAVIVASHEGRARCVGAPGDPCAYDSRGHWGVGNARSRARHHALRYPDHTLRLYQGARLVASVNALTWDDAEISDEFAETA